MAKPTARDIHDTAIMLAQQGRHADAALGFQKALMLKPDYADAWCNRANAIGAIARQLGPPFTQIFAFDACRGFDTAIAVAPACKISDPDLANYYNNRGVNRAVMDHQVGALNDYRKAAELNPKLPQVWSNIGNILRLFGDVEGARKAYAKSFEVEPTYYDAGFNHALMELELGNFEEGWKLFETRWRLGQILPRGLPCPNWEGQDLNGKRLLLYAEQGLGDTVQFVRYAREIKDKYPDATVNFECRTPLVRLMKTVPGISEVFAYGDDMPPHDYGCAIMTAPRILGTRFETIPAHVPYVSVNPTRVELWEQRLKHDTAMLGKKLRVGICWSGQARPLMPLVDEVDKRRSTALWQWAPIFKVPGVVLVSLQAGEPAHQAKSPPEGAAIAHYDEEFDDFTDTAALMKCLDLVISVDTSVVHVAGALGLPTWLLSRFDGCWRWHGNRTDSPWYPTVTQFRQPKLGDWTSVFDKVAHDLRGFERCAHRSNYSPIAAE
jgi:tetratricopeptide (TPR) repeat protein